MTEPAATPAEPVGRALVITSSTRAAAGVYPDRGGPILAAGLADLGFTVDGPVVVADGEPFAEALRAGVAAGYDVILTTGGTGLSPTDSTPEATAAVLDRPVPGLADAVRQRGLAAGVPTAALSRGLAGVAGSSLIVNLPGSTGGCRDGMSVLRDVLVHAVAQLRGVDHG
ncbi:molybdenum cofactor biosynthesis protein B [Spongisporangium articulatum]|uniref:Molybdenum cofactor biosynthesis protein B n=1 Tax=Spongisporangium articulatum TaxID=3362603 RepID=A0ABW8AS58_9ACTN